MSYLTINKQRGLTLVEIAIVLVIIGLLLGGILKGQELITSARVRSIADQNAGIQAAYYGFIDRYRAVPGDLLAADTGTSSGSCAVLGNFPSCATVGGDATDGNNGRIDDGSWAEASAVWAHLSAAGFLSGNYSGEGDAVADYEGPVNPYGGRMVLAQTNDYQPGGQTSGSGSTTTTATVPGRLNLALGNNVPVAVAREIDMKLDDSDPQTGVLRGALDTTTSFGTLTEQESDCLDSGEWNISSEQPNCTPIFLY